MVQERAAAAVGRLVRSPYLIAISTSALALLATWALLPMLEQGLFLFMYVALIVSAWYGGIRPTLIATTIMVLATAYLFIPPGFSFAFSRAGTFQLVIFILVGVCTGTLAEARKRAELAARARGEQLHVTLASIGDAVIVTDRDGAITFMNAVAEELTGWSQAEAYGRPSSAIFQVVHASSRQPLENPVTRVLRDGIVLEMTNHTVLIAKDGSERPIDNSGAPVRATDGACLGVVLVFRDIQERQRNEQERLQLLEHAMAARNDAEISQRRLTFLAEASTVFTASLDYEATIERVVQLAGDRLADWCTIFMRDAAAQRHWFTYAVADPEKRAVLEIIHERYPPDQNQRSVVSQALLTGESILIPELSEADYSSTVVDAEHLALLRALDPRSYMAIPLCLHEHIIGVLVLGITHSNRRFERADLLLAEEIARRAALAIENARLYAAERRSRAEAEAAVRMRDQFLSVAAHELRTPLTALQGNAELLQRRALREGGFEPRNQRIIQVIADQANRLSQMILALLDVTRLEIGQLAIVRAPIDLHALLRRIVDEIELTLDGRMIEILCPPYPLMVNADALRLEQVFHNLIQNALKYSEPPAPVSVRVIVDGALVQIAVTDHGIGVPQDALPHLFKRFFRAQNVEQSDALGLGIGLYVVHEVVTLHGGTVSVESTENQGSTFTVSLPLER